MKKVLKQERNPLETATKGKGKEVAGEVLGKLRGWQQVRRVFPHLGGALREGSSFSLM